MKTLALATVLATLLFGATSAHAIIARPVPQTVPQRPDAPFGWTYQWVPPTYRTIVDRYWVPETRQLVADWVEVRPGRWEQVYREIINPGHWENRTRQVQVSAGFWQLVRMDPRPFPRPRPGTVGVDGFGSYDVEDLSRFTPLYEWPR